MLKLFADLLQLQVRDVDIAGRYGGDEFIAVLPDTNLEGAVIVAQRLLASMKAAQGFLPDLEKMLTRKILLPENQILSCSIGIGNLNHDRHKTISQIISEADEALYRSKKAGKSRYTIYEEQHQIQQEQRV